MSQSIKQANGKYIGESIKQIAKEREITLAAVAQKIGKPRQFMSDIIANRRIIHPSELVDICRVLETTPNVLLGFKESREILVTYGAERELIASISDDDVIVKEGYEVAFH